MGKKQADRKQTLGEEITNSITHGVGAALAVAGFVVAVVWAVMYGNGYSVASAIVYGITLIILYSMSTLYHAFTGKTVKKVFRIFDHCSIFLLIAGTYTPYALVALNGVKGWIVFGIIWFVAILGIVLNSVSIEKFKKFSMVCYLVMGWMIIMFFGDLTKAVGFMPGILLLILGGVAYTVGAVFYALSRHKYMHGVWHLFVLAGSILHYFSILLYVLPVK